MKSDAIDEDRKWIREEIVRLERKALLIEYGIPTCIFLIVLFLILSK